ncbi:family 20 glycosylhydrolase [Subsaxibacter sp. CAU 1640]|uniref:beta-N-acetylhexosaminidase n=1 Tax=Subsaxibacter sp. CAU 1640 TaxID=2933271 RepID=UPI0020030CBE|nr:family 20 glycosylhydrolase [Subsaxibacter sp. CAU 1640]MCK7590846.1 family 20 glycosylhydrolase [Subsaxibacter sp. CAU 1640]
MPFRKLPTLIVFISFLSSVLVAQNEITKLPIIPNPSISRLSEGTFSINNMTGITFDKELEASANYLKDYIEKGSNIRLQKGKGIFFIKDNSIKNPEGYLLLVIPGKIEIKAKTDQGAFYAVQSLRQLLPETFENGSYSSKNVYIPATSIFDEPKFQYRGMHLDVARHFFSVEFIKKYIDMLAMLKLNTFHWHLTDDQGWRIEIQKYPKLQEIAAYRNETLIGHYNTDPQQFDGKRYGGFYTQEEVKEVVAYAKSRHITVIPEIEMPGHAQAAISAYPELGCTGEQISAATKWGVFEDIFCPKEETFEFLEGVLDEVLDLFPSEYIHIGGDEAPKTRWKACPHCQNLIKEKGLKDEHELQSYFITRMEKFLNEKGRQIIGWDEILEGGLAPNATVMSWRGTNGAVEAAKQHHNVIMTPTSHLYFDYYQSENDDEPLAIGGFLPLEKVYNFNPIPKELSDEEAKFVLGAQANLWTEYITTEQQVEYMVFPRMLALSEMVWSKPENKNYDDFVQRVEHFHKRLDALGINYANHLYEIEGNLTANGYELKTLTNGKNIRYSLDGSEPNLDSKIYSNPIPINENTYIKATVFDDGTKLGNTFSQAINPHLAFGKKITLNVEPNKAYSGSGATGLINGISGSDKRFGDKEWLGFWGDDVEITIDLGEEKQIQWIKTRFYDAQGQWIYAPKNIEITFDDGRRFPMRPDTSILHPKKSIKYVSIVTNIKSRFLKIKVKNFGTIPEGKQGAGNKAWTFIDEIIIK